MLSLAYLTDGKFPRPDRKPHERHRGSDAFRILSGGASGKGLIGASIENNPQAGRSSTDSIHGVYSYPLDTKAGQGPHRVSPQELPVRFGEPRGQPEVIRAETDGLPGGVKAPIDVLQLNVLQVNGDPIGQNDFDSIVAIVRSARREAFIDRHGDPFQATVDCRCRINPLNRMGHRARRGREQKQERRKQFLFPA